MLLVVGNILASESRKSRLHVFLQFSFGHSIWLLSWRLPDENSLCVPYFFETNSMPGRLGQFSFIDWDLTWKLQVQISVWRMAVLVVMSIYRHTNDGEQLKVDQFCPLFFCDVSWNRMVIVYRRFCTTYPSYLRASVANDMLSRNVRTQLPTYVA